LKTLRQSIFLLLFCVSISACNSNNKTESTETSKIDSTELFEEPETGFPNELDELAKPSNEKYKDTVFHVSSFDEFYRALGSNRTIYLAENTINLPDKYAGNTNVNLELNFGLNISGLSNLKIVGSGSKRSKIIQPNSAYKVLNFKGCTNIILENIEAGHAPAKGGCAASVLYFDECSGVFLNNCDLFGCGFEGISTMKVENLNCNNIIIRECSFEIMSISQSNTIRFFNSRFIHNDKPYGSGRFYFARSNKIMVHNCIIEDNAAHIDIPNYQPLFQVDDCEQTYIRQNSFKNNKSKLFLSDSTGVTLNGNHFAGNEWERVKK